MDIAHFSEIAFSPTPKLHEITIEDILHDFFVDLCELVVLVLFGGELVVGGDNKMVLLSLLSHQGQVLVEHLHLLEDLLQSVPVGVGLLTVAALDASQQQVRARLIRVEPSAREAKVEKSIVTANKRELFENFGEIMIDL